MTRHPVFSIRFRAAFRRLGVSQAEAAGKWRVSQPTISNWLSGRYSPSSLETLAVIAADLGVTIDYLVGRGHK